MFNGLLKEFLISYGVIFAIIGVCASWTIPILGAIVTTGIIGGFLFFDWKTEYKHFSIVE